MAEASNNTSRRSILGGAVALAATGAVAAPAIATPVEPDRAKWDRRLYRYEMLYLLMDADEKVGAFWAADNDREYEHLSITCDYGTFARARLVPEGAKRCEAYTEKSDALDRKWAKDFVNPTERAAILVAKTPAPDFAALKRKVEIIKEHDLHNFTWFKGDPMDYVHADAKRLMALRA